MLLLDNEEIYIIFFMRYRENSCLPLVIQNIYSINNCFYKFYKFSFILVLLSMIFNNASPGNLMELHHPGQHLLLVPRHVGLLLLTNKQLIIVLQYTPDSSTKHCTL